MAARARAAAAAARRRARPAAYKDSDEEEEEEEEEGAPGKRLPPSSSSASSLAITTPASLSAPTAPSPYDDVSLRMRAVARPIVIVWSPLFVYRLLRWVEVADSTASEEGSSSSGGGGPSQGGAAAGRQRSGSWHPNPIPAAPAAAGAGASAAAAAAAATPDSAWRASSAAVFGMVRSWFSECFLTSVSGSIEATISSHRRKVDALAFLAAPVLVVPQRSTTTGQGGGELAEKPCPMAVLDMGALTFRSILAPPPAPRGSASASASGGATPAPPLPSLQPPRSSLPSLSQPSSGLGGGEAPAPAPAAADAAEPPTPRAHLRALSASIAPYLPSFFDKYMVTVSGVSLALTWRVVLPSAEDFEPRLHHRVKGSSELAIIVGAEPPPDVPLPPRAELALGGGRRRCCCQGQQQQR